jgi:hypothetical protein
MGPLMFSLGIRSLLRDLASTLGPGRLILAYLDDIYILSPDDLALEQTLAFFNERQPSIRLNPAKCKSLALEDIRTNGLRMLGTCVGARSAREQFLQEKIEHEAATVAKLINLPHQHALLVLRVCVQQNLRHLQRSLKSDDLVHLWDKLDTTLREAVARIRGLPRPTDQLDAAVISLPIKMGGIGILSYKTVAPQAYAAASEAADTTLAPILNPGTLPASTQLITQHQRCQEIFTGNKEALLGSLTPEQAKAVVEASSKLGRVWLTTIPFQPSLRLTDFEVAAALQLRTLAGEREAHCNNCGETNFFGHPEVCLQRKFRRVARHEGAKHIMGQALASTPGTRVRLELLARCYAGSQARAQRLGQSGIPVSTGVRDATASRTTTAMKDVEGGQLGVPLDESLGPLPWSRWTTRWSQPSGTSTRRVLTTRLARPRVHVLGDIGRRS